jgi:hypothetical protein
MQYTIRRATAAPTLTGDWDSPQWRHAQVAQLDAFHAASSDHRPRTSAKMLHDDAGLYVIFRVEDRFVVCTRGEHQTLTSKDSCVEVYFQPFENKGYFNFEMNCGGSLLLFYVIDPTRVPQGAFREKRVLPKSLLETMKIFHSMPRTTPTEITGPMTWIVEFFVPHALIEAYVGPLGEPARRRWRGNFFKCADESSHPHWASWNPVGPDLNFHVSAHFAPMVFEPAAPT